eukprot:SAG11_NODE_26646_length_342_cov_1.452675_1_plen_102_part_01
MRLGVLACAGLAFAQIGGVLGKGAGSRSVAPLVPRAMSPGGGGDDDGGGGGDGEDLAGRRPNHGREAVDVHCKPSVLHVFQLEEAENEIHLSAMLDCHWFDA